MPKSVTFSEAIALSQSLLETIATGVDELETEQAVASLVRDRDGARGFFVTYLTSDLPVADQPSPGVIRALQSAPENVGELLVKNLAMSAAMAVTHRRNGNEEMAQSSARVRQRTAKIIEQVQLQSVSEQLQQLKKSLATGEGEYQEFLQRWGYDNEQRQVIEQTINQYQL